MKFRHVLIVVALLLIGVLVSRILVPIRRASKDWAETVCDGQLKNLAVFAISYANKQKGYFPHSPDGSLATLQQLVDAFPEVLPPPVFICPDGQETCADVGDGRLTLTTETCSYEAVPWRLKRSDRNAILYYDNEPHHERGEKRIVVLTDGRTLVMDEHAFQKRIEEERARFGSR